MPRGGKRQGSPGKTYSNRTDMMTNYDNAGSSAAAGGMAPVSREMKPPAVTPSRTPEDSPMLTAPSQYPDEPLTAGLDYGPGANSSALDMPTYNSQRDEDMQIVRQMIPDLKLATRMTNAPESFKTLVRYLERM